MERVSVIFRRTDSKIHPPWIKYNWRCTHTECGTMARERSVARKYANPRVERATLFLFNADRLIYRSSYFRLNVFRLPFFSFSFIVTSPSTIYRQRFYLRRFTECANVIKKVGKPKII